MSLKAYEDACLRAELFGQPKPDKDEFLAKNKHLDIVEFEEVDIKSAENTAMLGGDINATSGGFVELNTILNSTQTKINKLKGVCGSLTNFFRVKLAAKDNLSYSSEPSYVGQTNYDKDYVPPETSAETGSVNTGLGPSDRELSVSTSAGKSTVKFQNGGDINSALSDLENMQEIQGAGLLSKSTVKDLGAQVTSQVDKLDRILQQADRAQSSMDHQNKQMASILRKK
ncbi:unnamed protein product [Plutella xylostella]|uniref:(diamondback moth) hypothetical protein n=1 Tax=Plutella xylostella TaxID=51655 RepID=A0A8S4FE64_PLUXY|nr:unnamed protein product [Plutella xylostella]